jgi:small subunit ribosomal protein S8
MSDTIGNMLTTIRNGYAARKDRVRTPYSSLNESIAKKLLEMGYLSSIEVDKSGEFKVIDLGLKYDNGKPALTKIRRISKPGLRRYNSARSIRKVLSGLGFSILTTPKGVLSGIEAKKAQIGGEVICEGW